MSTASTICTVVFSASKRVMMLASPANRPRLRRAKDKHPHAVSAMRREVGRMMM